MKCERKLWASGTTLEQTGRKRSARPGLPGPNYLLKPAEGVGPERSLGGSRGGKGVMGGGW